MWRTSQRPARRGDRQRKSLWFDMLERRELLSIEPVSLASPTYTGPTGNDISGLMGEVAVSAQGRYVAFVSDATNLTPNATNSLPNLYRFDRTTGTMTLISVGANGKAAGLALHDTDVRAFVMSPDGNSFAFVSDTLQLGLGGAPASRLFLRNVAAQSTTLLSIRADGTPATVDPNTTLSISNDGRYVAFLSQDSGFVTGLNNTFPQDDIFVRDVVGGTTLPVDVTPDGHAFSDAGALTPVLSADGRYIAFTSGASNLLPGVTGLASQVYRRNLATGKTELVSLGTDGQPGNDNSSGNPGIEISGNGQFIAFATSATNLVADDTVSGNILVRRDMSAHTTIMASILPDGTPALNEIGAQMTPDGHTVAFSANIASAAQSIIVRDLDTGLSSDATAGPNGIDFNVLIGLTGVPTFDLSADGTKVVFTTASGTFDPRNPLGVLDTYVYDVSASTTTLLTSRFQSSDPAYSSDYGTVANLAATALGQPARLSADGSVAVFTSDRLNLIADDDNFVSDVFARDLATPGASTELISQRDPSLPENKSLTGNTETAFRLAGSLSGDGHLVAFVSGHSNMSGLPDPTDFGATRQVYVRNLQTGTTTLVGQPIGSDLYDSSGQYRAYVVPDQIPILSTDGRYVAFVQMVAYGGGGGTTVAFVRDLSTGAAWDATITILGLPMADSYATRILGITADDQKMLVLAYGYSSVSPLDPAEPPPPPGAESLYEVDLHGGNAHFVNSDASGARIDLMGAAHYAAAISPDGRFVAFETADGAYVKDLQSGDLTRVHDTSTNSERAASDVGVVFSPDSRRVAFLFNSTDQSDPARPTFGATTYVSSLYPVSAAQRINTGAGARTDNGIEAFAPAFSADGRFLAFLDTPAAIGEPVVYAYDFVTGARTPASVNPDGSPGPILGGPGGTIGHAVANDGLSISANGRFITYRDNRGQVCVRDLWQRTTTLVSATPDGAPGNGESSVGDTPRLSSDGTEVLFTSRADDLYPRDRNGSNGTDDFIYHQTVTDAPSGVVAGKVSQGTNQPLANVTVYIDANHNGLPDDPIKTVTADDGTYEFLGLPAGTYHVGVVLPNGLAVDSPVAGSQDAVLANDTSTAAGADFHVITANGAISGKVTVTGGDPAPGITVYIDANHNGVADDPLQALTVADGTYTLSGLVAGTYHVSVSLPPDYHATNPASGATDITLATLNSTASNVNFEVNPNTPQTTIAGHVIDVSADGGPLDGVTVYVDANKDGKFNDPVHTTTDSNGYYHISGLPRGTYRVTFVGDPLTLPTDPASGFLDVTLSSDIAMQTATDFNVKEVPPKEITGHVLNGSNHNKPLANWVVFVDDNHDGRPDSSFVTTTGTDGSYTLTDLLPGTHRVGFFIQPGFKAMSPAAGYADVNVTASDATIVQGPNFIVTGATPSGLISGTIHGPSGLKLSNVDVYDDANHDGRFDDLINTFASSNGAYSLGLLVDGSYRMRVIAPPGYQVVSPASGYRDITIGAGGRTFKNVDFTLARVVDGPHVVTFVINTRTKPAQFSLTFDADLNVSRATNSAAFSLVDAGPDGKFGTSDDKSIGIKATYKNRTVTLTLTGTFNPKDLYRFVVAGTGKIGLTDTIGHLLDGSSSGSAGSNFQLIIRNGHPSSS